MPAVVYLLCAVTSLICMVLLGFAFLRTKSRLLLWSAMCFVGLAINNILLFIDLVVLPTQVDLSIPRTLAALCGVTIMLVAFVWEGER